ncbi:DAK2 domain-containing protein [Alkalicoccobacillus gibsonii]|uniref:DAK2 domain-containing protein n=1 Tax=Alkalicoccobacillus gibsonii TaxID=79881 RepID=UPI00193264B1|nr:DAK2 domain-containing protein [Alkalicoccobacillus gibsonii]MBM0065726.1 DAK2 domain-containing protein [Alkalicoccobacillus gibsonii]
MNVFTIELATSWIEQAKKELASVREYLSLIDQDVGDGDHGEHVVRAFEEITPLRAASFMTLREVFEYTGDVLLKKEGSSAVKLYGVAFKEMGLSFHGSEASLDEFSQAIRAAVEKMKEVGQAKRGDKTLIDVWEAIAELTEKEKALSSINFEDKAKTVLKASKYLLAQKGKAAEYGSNSVGFLDPGTVSSYYLFDALTHVLSEAEANEPIQQTS